MNWHRIFALVRRYTFLYQRSVPRMIELLFWPVMDLLVWGFVSVYLEKLNPQVPGAVTFLIGAMIFWDILFRSQQSVTLAFLEDIWSRNLLNIFVSPLRPREFLMGTFIVGLMRIAIIVSILGTMASLLYGFHLSSIGLALVPLCANLLVMGLALGMVATALILRFGQSAENLAWAVPFLIQPVAAVFYPVSVLPVWLQPVAMMVPATHVFEGMRSLLKGGPFPGHELLLATLLNVVWLAAAGWFFSHMFAAARERGYLAKLGTQ
jgi:ABC-2 type transport system permease protein